jgi:MoxR-like ATPase
MSLQAAAARVRAFQADVSLAVPERHHEIACVTNALVQRQHVLLLGPPGAAKSLLARIVCSAIGGDYFEVLMGKYTVPEEVFGPLDLPALRQGVYTRAVNGYMPTASVAFVDECFKANSAILNSMLTILNERTYKQGVHNVACPLETCIGASNELPADEGLGALYDRFLFRRWVSYLTDQDDWWAVTSMVETPKIKTTIAPADLATLRAALPKVDISGLRENFTTLKTALARETEIQVSDRRWRALAGAVRAQAVIAGRTTADPRDMLILTDAIWNKPDERPDVARAVANAVSPAAADAQRLLDAAIEAIGGLDLNAPRIDLAKAGAVNGQLADILRQTARLPTDPVVVEIVAKINEIKSAVARAVTRELT